MAVDVVARILAINAAGQGGGDVDPSKIIEIGLPGQTEPSEDLLVGGLFYERV